jgi:hypothetical protein
LAVPLLGSSSELTQYADGGTVVQIHGRSFAIIGQRKHQTRGKGILLLHDIHPATVTALRGLLKELRQQDFHIPHMWRQLRSINSNGSTQCPREAVGVLLGSL